MRPIDLLVFDCDGVLLDTMEAKIGAFRAWIPEAYAESHGSAFMERVMHGFGTSRQRHIQRFYEDIVKIEVDAAFLEAEVARFTDICEPRCANAQWRTGSKEFVQACREAGIRRYVLSGTPQASLEAMLESSGGNELFDVIIGSPPAKPESMDRILAETHTPGHRTVFVGDAHADYLAAVHVGAHFVYFPSEAPAPEGELLTTVRDLREILVGE